MSLNDLDNSFIDNKVPPNLTAIEQLDAKNQPAALYLILEQVAHVKGTFAITEDIVLGILLRLMNGIVSDAGQYRRHAVRIVGAHVPLANWQSVPKLMAELTNADEHSVDIVSLLAKVHATFEKIHPFSDGNGRTGRRLMLAQALNGGIAPPIVLKERKQAYYRYLEFAQTKDEYTPLEFFVAESIQSSGKLLL